MICGILAAAASEEGLTKGCVCFAAKGRKLIFVLVDRLLL